MNRRTMVLTAAAFCLLTAARANSAEGEFRPVVKTFYWFQAGYYSDETNDDHGSFQFKRARFGFRGKATPKIGYHLMIEALDEGVNPKVYQDWAQYEFDPLLKVRVGQFKYPFGVEAYPCFVWWKFLNISYASGMICKELVRKDASAESGYCRDIGVEASGSYRLDPAYTLRYNLMIFNGNGILQTDNNGYKDVVVAAGLKTAHGLDLGGAYYFGKFRAVGGTKDYGENGLSLHATWDNKLLQRDFRLQGNVMLAQYDTAGDEVKPWGFYGLGTWFVLPRVEAGLRYDYFDTDRAPETGKLRRRTTLQASYHFAAGHWVMANYEIVDDAFKNTENQFMLIFQVALEACLLK